MEVDIPQQMRAVYLNEYRQELDDAIRGLTVVNRPVPKPRRGQVLIKMAAAPCNPSDLLLLQGRYGTLKSLPTVPGWEGAGTVVAAGGGWLPTWLLGRRVACGLQGDADGTWAEYFLANAKECIPLKRNLSLEQGATLIVNPLTAVGLLDTAQRHDHPAAVVTAGASQLGRMILRLAAETGYPLIFTVRRPEQIKLLESMGADHVLNTSADDFPEKLGELAQELSATAVFEAVAGDTTGTVLRVLPRGSTVFVYGGLSGDACGNIDPIDLIFQDKTITGFYLGQWAHERGALGMLRAANRVQRSVIAGRIETKVQRRLGLDDVVDGLQQYVRHMTDGKVLITPHGL